MSHLSSRQRELEFPIREDGKPRAESAQNEIGDDSEPKTRSLTLTMSRVLAALDAPKARKAQATYEAAGMAWALRKMAEDKAKAVAARAVALSVTAWRAWAAAPSAQANERRARAVATKEAADVAARVQMAVEQETWAKRLVMWKAHDAAAEVAWQMVERPAGVAGEVRRSERLRQRAKAN